jgi:DNA-binding NarL/FixJ family response regulator
VAEESEMAKITIIIAEDEEEIRNYFKEIIAASPDMEVIGTACNGEEAWRIAIEKKPAIVLMDIQMKTRTDGIEAAERIKKANPAIKIIIVTIHNQDIFLFRAYAAGAMDYIIKTDPVESILASIRAVASNTFMLRPEIAGRIMAESRRIGEGQNRMKEILKVMMKITNTELEIIRLVYEGAKYREIADKRFVEETTIRSEIHRILEKFGKRSMKDLVALLKDIEFFETFDLD